MYELYNQHLSQLHSTGRYRKLPHTHLLNCLNFSTNDYLKLSQRSELLDAAIVVAKIYGVGATGSRLLSGNNEIFESLEYKIAKDKNTESALVFNSGFQTNISVLSSLLDQKVLKTKPKFIISETIFGMDGDILPINQVVSLSIEHQAFLYLDEAHATGVIGHNGYGLSTTIDLKNIPHLIMGTFSKALGCSGGYIACSQVLKDYLINKAPGFIYSTANSPMTLGAANKAWDMIKGFDAERIYLFDMARKLRDRLINSGFNIGTSESHIIPIIFGKEELAIHAKNVLIENNVAVSCVRPPTVPHGTSRIRIALNIKHTEQDINQLINVLKTL